MRRLFISMTAFLLLASATMSEAQESVTVFAAASTTNALDEIGALFAAKGLGNIRPSYASSSTLAKQIEQGAPAHLFVSADLKWADYLAERKLLNPDFRINLLGNRLVLIAPADAKTPQITLDKTTDLAALLGNGRLAVGDPDHVPVGLYAKQALQGMKQWERLEPRLARASSVRAALALVERGEAPLGIVYSTDAAVAKNVKVVAAFPESLHETILYPFALV
ncbi:MAG: molybdate ABC transporter substrate-binding protein, partial [Rhodospirillales bacterium]